MKAPFWTPTQADYTEIFLEQNPWHSEGSVPETLCPPTKRFLAKHLWKRLVHPTLHRFQLVLGPRRVGKSTVLYQTVQSLLDQQISPRKIWWLRLDHPLLIEIHLGDLVRMVVDLAKATPDEPVFLFLDEITYGRDWDLWLKTFYDERWPVRLAGSSSATAALRERRTESGVGRWEEQYLSPYLLGELLTLLGLEHRISVEASLGETIASLSDSHFAIGDFDDLLMLLLVVGGFPELLVRPQGQDLQREGSFLKNLVLQSQQTLRQDAIERSVYKDIPQTFGLESPLVLERLLYTLAGQIGGILQPKNICSKLGGLSQPTFDKYLSYLQQSYLLFTLSNYSGSEISVQRRGRKLYFIDTAVRNAALQRGIAPLKNEDELGQLRENLLAAHLHVLGIESGTRIYYWRNEKNDEGDLLFAHPEYPIAFEVASSRSHHTRGLLSLVDRHEVFSNRVFLAYPNAPHISPRKNNGIGTISLQLLLLAISAQVEAEQARRFAV